MRKISIYCVNYHSYDSLRNYLNSIETAVRQVMDQIQLSVFVADNSVPATSFDYPSQKFTLEVLPTGQNLGYFGAIRLLMQKYSPEVFDYTIISNVDVLLYSDFFRQLLSLSESESIGWIAPEIYSTIEQRDRNPKIMRRYPKRKLQILKNLFRIPLLYNLYTHSVYKSKKLIQHEAGQIYAGHGSFIILTQQYFQQCGIIDYPIFLFCEEIYLGEQCRQNGLKVVYDPTLKVTDAEHTSTSAFKRNKYCQLNLQAISYILKTYY